MEGDCEETKIEFLLVISHHLEFEASHGVVLGAHFFGTDAVGPECKGSKPQRSMP